MTQVKICGITDPESMTAAIESGADFVGLVFYPPSPRYVETPQAAYLASYVPKTVKKVGLFVNPTDELLQQILNEVPLDMLQLHGKERPERIQEIKDTFRLPVIKCISVAAKSDVDTAQKYEDAADWIMFDAKADPNVSQLPGGNGLAFDWTLLQQFRSKTPWFLAGGLTPENVREAIELLNPNAVDVSSGVERAPGEKDPGKIRDFLKLARSNDKG